MNTAKLMTNIVSAKNEFCRLYSRMLPEADNPLLPDYFDCCEIGDIDFDNKKILLVFHEYPVCVPADGCAVNAKVMQVLAERIGLVTPAIRCVVHAMDGSIKRMTKPATYSVEEVKDFTTNLGPVLRHFKLSGKSTSLLNDALANLEMKPIHLMTWCPTRMSYILTASKRTVETLVPLCDVLVSADIKRVDKLYFMSAKSMIILHIPADLESTFIGSLLRKSDSDDSLIIEAYHCAVQFAEGTRNKFDTPLLDAFLGGVQVDNHGNVLVKIKIGESTHVITLNESSRPVGRVGAQPDKVAKIHDLAKELKEEIVENIISNVLNQAQKDTLVEYSSCFDLTAPFDLDARLENLQKLHLTFCKEYTHTVTYPDDSELETDLERDFKISIKYPPKINCSYECLKSEFRSLWPVFNRMWPKYASTAPQHSRLMRCLKYVVSNYTITQSNLCEMILLLLAISPGKGPLERSYSKVCTFYESLKL